MSAADAERGSVPIKCPHCPEAIDLSWSPTALHLNHRGRPCGVFSTMIADIASLVTTSPETSSAVLTVYERAREGVRR